MAIRIGAKMFRKYAESHNPSDFAGESRSPYNCPIARFLGRSASVSPSIIRIGNTYEYRETKSWENKFIIEIDCLGGDNRGRMTFDDVVNVLNEIGA